MDPTKFNSVGTAIKRLSSLKTIRPVAFGTLWMCQVEWLRTKVGWNSTSSFGEKLSSIRSFWSFPLCWWHSSQCWFFICLLNVPRKSHWPSAFCSLWLCSYYWYRRFCLQLPTQFPLWPNICWWPLVRATKRYIPETRQSSIAYSVHSHSSGHSLKFN